jgi:hypothetical protein
VTRVGIPAIVIVAERVALSGVAFGSFACAAFIFYANSLLDPLSVEAMSAPLKLANGFTDPLMSVA